MGMRVEEEKGKNSTGIVFFRREDVSPEVLEKAAEVRRLLKLPPAGDKFTLVFSPGRGAENELAINSRSMLQIIGAFASYMDVPQEHLKDHSATPSFENDPQKAQQVRIHSGKEKPKAAFAAVYYRDHWFWIDDSDWRTKRVLTAVMFFFTLSDTGAPEKLPLITIPAQ
jgi:hypothetical protein